MKQDCFACKEGGCTALDTPLCERRDCPFYKTEEQLLVEQLETSIRIRTLPLEDRLHIRDKYYRGI